MDANEIKMFKATAIGFFMKWRSGTATSLSPHRFCLFHTPAWMQTIILVWRWVKISIDVRSPLDFQSFDTNIDSFREILVINGWSVSEGVDAVVKFLLVLIVDPKKGLQWFFLMMVLTTIQSCLVVRRVKTGNMFTMAVVDGASFQFPVSVLRGRILRRWWVGLVYCGHASVTVASLRTTSPISVLIHTWFGAARWLLRICCVTFPRLLGGFIPCVHLDYASIKAAATQLSSISPVSFHLMKFAIGVIKVASLNCSVDIRAAAFPT